jgi:hypothetical protein
MSTILRHYEPFPVGSGLKNMFFERDKSRPRDKLPYLDVTWLGGSLRGSYFQKPGPVPLFTDRLPLAVIDCTCLTKAVSRSRSFHCKLTAQLSLLHAYTTSRSWCKVDHLRPHGQVDTLGFQALPRCGADVAGTAGSNPHYVFCLVYSPVGRRVEMMAVTA